MSKRWWIPNVRSNLGAVRRAFAWLDAATAPGEPAGLVVDSRNALFDGDIEEALGEQAVKLLASMRIHRLPSRGELQAISMHGNRGRLRFPGAVLLIYPDKKRLDFVDQIEALTEVLVVPWEHDEVACWLKQWSASELGSPSVPGRAAEKLDPVVREAFGDLFGALIATEGKLRPKDKPLVIGLLAVLRENDVNFTAEQLRNSVVVEHGKNPMLADDIEGVANDVLAGLGLNHGKRLWNEKSITRWRTKAANRTTQS